MDGRKKYFSIDYNKKEKNLIKDFESVEINFQISRFNG